MDLDEENINLKNSNSNQQTETTKVGQEQIHGLLFGEQLSWQAIIYDLINTNQLEPWDIDLVLLTNKYLERIRELEEANLFVSSKVLFAASLLLRIKSEILLDRYIPSLDSILFGKKEEEKKYIQERIELDEEIPELVQKTPLPRFRKVTLQELMRALGKAIKTENRRIRRSIVLKQREMEVALALPKRRINIRDLIEKIYSKLKKIFSSKEERVAFSEFLKHNGREKVSTFVPLLHLDYQHKVLLEQENHLDEIWIWLKQHHNKKYAKELEKMRKEVEETIAQEAEMEKIEELKETGKNLKGR
ncbi:segregation/condensation protein A [Candidatus Pacearchaeota archaeon]|nr:segregation/condensation protein A [Candidatus Pacearchaeota archaeon]